MDSQKVVQSYFRTESQKNMSFTHDFRSKFPHIQMTDATGILCKTVLLFVVHSVSPSRVGPRGDPLDPG